MFKENRLKYFAKFGGIFMSRGRSFVSIARSMASASAAEARRREAEMRRLERERLRQIREQEKSLALMQKELKQQYIESRLTETEDKNHELTSKLADLQSILANIHDFEPDYLFNTLRIKETFAPFKIPDELVKPPNKPEENYYYTSLKAPGLLGKMIPSLKNRYNRQLEEAKARFQEDFKEYEIEDKKRLDEIGKLQEEYEKEKKAYLQKVADRDREVDEIKTAFNRGDRETIITCTTLALEQSDYPEDFEINYKLAFVPESKMLVVEYQLPNKEIVPQIAEFKYVKTRDEITEKQRKPAEIKEIYQDVIAALTLRTIYEALSANEDKVEVIVFNGFVKTVDPATGKDIQPYIISVRTTKQTFSELDLRSVDKITCLRNLGAQVSSRPTELQPVKPILEFNMDDKRFIEQEDILDTLDNRPNLMDLSPFEFEHFISNLFNKMGLDTKLTRSSKDGGVDAVAFDTRPIVGGKVVIQAKRYKNPVGVSAVRDLYGTMINEGANKGILVTTSYYGSDAYEFCKDKPIELIDGGGLLYLLKEHGYKARIIFPEE